VTVTALIAAARSGQFEHVAQRARDDRDQEAERLTAAGALTAQGVTVIEEDSVDETEELYYLTDDQETKEPLTAESHAACPGHAAYLVHRWAWNTGDDDSDGRAGRSSGRYEWQPVWVCTAPVANGHHTRYQPLPQTHSASLPGEDSSEEDREAARAGRREVIENNKACESAERVRRTWLKTFLTRKTAPKGTAAFAAAALAQDAALLDGIGGNHLASELFGGTAPSYGRSAHLLDLAADASDGRAQVILLGIVLAAYEDFTSREDWRTTRATTVRYLTHLATLGYQLSEVEGLAAG